MHFSILSLFPEYFAEPLKQGLVGQSFEKGRVGYTMVNPRSFSADPVHKSVDDRPFGGGDGMVMTPEPLAQAIEQAKASQPGARTRVINFSPQGRPLTQGALEELLNYDHLVLVCGRYAGLDERLVHALVDEEVSVGDFVLSGGEPAALCLIDALARLLPHTLGNKISVEADSFSVESVFESPLFTRPAEWRGIKVPDILLSGHHQKIEEFRSKVGLIRALLRRPDLVAAIDPTLKAKALRFVKSLSAEDQEVLGLADIANLEKQEQPWPRELQ